MLWDISAFITTITPTIIVIIMASILFCCWHKKGSGKVHLKEEKCTKNSTKHNSDVLVCEKRGKVTEIPNSPQCGMKLPLLSSEALGDNKEITGDFSAVQRETEILRPYTKPPPPRRAKQNRAPKAFKNDRKSLDIFTELLEDLNNHGSDKENADSDDVDVILRQNNERTKRDTRSSMLADIEQTLAVMHMEEQFAVPTLKGSSSSKEKSSNIRDAQKESNDSLTITERQLEENNFNNVYITEELSEDKTEPAVTAEKELLLISPIAKPRKGPKVSPKPSPKPNPKVRSNWRCHDDKIEAQATNEKSSDTPNSVSFTSSSDLKIGVTHSSLDIKLPTVTLCSEANMANEKPHEETKNAKEESPLEEVPTLNALPNIETTMKNDQQLNSTSPEETKTNLVFTKETNKAGKTNVSNANSLPDDIENSDTISDKPLDRDDITKLDNENNDDRQDEHSDDETKSKSLISNGHETENSLHKQPTQEDQDLSVTKNRSDKSSDEEAKQAFPDEETSPCEYGGTRRSRSEETRKEQRESNEDQTGKGKTSKIPIRAGSKHRSSSPKLLSTEKVSGSPN